MNDVYMSSGCSLWNFGCSTSYFALRAIIIIFIGKDVIIMIEKDTVRLLRECDAGVKMGITGIDEVLPFVGDKEFKDLLEKCKAEHDKLDSEIQELLDKYEDDGKEPAAIAKGMSWMITTVMLALNESDETIADLMTDGCNMGVKSLNKYLNKYKAADEVSKDITKRLINIEEKLIVDIRKFL